MRSIEIYGFIRNSFEDCKLAGLFGLGCSAVNAAISSESFRPMVAGNVACAVFSSLIGNATFRAAAKLIEVTNIQNPTVKKAILVVAAVLALLATTGVGVLISDRLGKTRSEEFIDSFESGMVGSLLPMLFLMKDRYNQAARSVGLPLDRNAYRRGRGQDHGHGHGHAASATASATATAV